MYRKTNLHYLLFCILLHRLLLGCRLLYLLLLRLNLHLNLDQKILSFKILIFRGKTSKKTVGVKAGIYKLILYLKKTKAKIKIFIKKQIYIKIDVY